MNTPTFVAELLTALQKAQDQILSPEALLVDYSELGAYADELDAAALTLGDLVTGDIEPVLTELRLAHAALEVWSVITKQLRFFDSVLLVNTPSTAHTLAGFLALREEAAQQVLAQVVRAKDAILARTRKRLPDFAAQKAADGVTGR